MAKKKITVEEGGKLNEQVESLVEKSSTSNNVDNKSSQASDPLTDVGIHKLTEKQKQYACITVRLEFNFSK